MRTLLTCLLAGLLVALGVAALTEGQRDDAPGLGGLGLVVIVAAVVLVVRRARRRA